MAAHESKGFCHYSSVWNVLSKNDEDPRLLEHMIICLWSESHTSYEPSSLSKSIVYESLLNFNGSMVNFCYLLYNFIVFKT